MTWKNVDRSGVTDRSPMAMRTTRAVKPPVLRNSSASQASNVRGVSRKGSHFHERQFDRFPLHKGKEGRLPARPIPILECLNGPGNVLGGASWSLADTLVQMACDTGAKLAATSFCQSVEGRPADLAKHRCRPAATACSTFSACATAAPIVLTRCSLR